MLLPDRSSAIKALSTTSAAVVVAIPLSWDGTPPAYHRAHGDARDTPIGALAVRGILHRIGFLIRRAGTRHVDQ